MRLDKLGVNRADAPWVNGTRLEQLGVNGVW